MIQLDPQSIMRRKKSRQRINRIFTVVCWASASISVVVLAVLLTSIVQQGLKYLDWDFITGLPSRDAGKAGMLPPIIGSIWICAICTIVALPLGVGTAIFLEEYKPMKRWPQRLHAIVQLNISNLAGVPSIVYGIIGLTIFVQMFSHTDQPWWQIGVTYFDQVTDEAGNYMLFKVDGRNAPPVQLVTGTSATTDLGEDITIDIASAEKINALWSQLDAALAELPSGTSDGAFATREKELKAELFAGVLPDDFFVERVDEKSFYFVQVPFGRGVLAGGLTLMMVILPIVIVSAQEAIRAVPPILREGAAGLGATKWQIIRRIVLPGAVPGITTGSILAVSRVIGEAAPILIIAGIVYITFTPTHVMDDFTTMPLQIYNWAGLPNKEFHQVAASGIIVLLAILLSFNATAIFVRQKFQRPLQ